MMKISKKAQVKPMQEIITALLVLGFAIFIMAIFSGTYKNSQLEEGEKFMGSAIAENTFALYLKQQVQHEGLDLTMADLIVLAAENKGKYEGVWKKETERFFSVYKINADEIEIKVPEKGLKIKIEPKAFWYRDVCYLTKLVWCFPFLKICLHTLLKRGCIY